MFSAKIKAKSRRAGAFLWVGLFFAAVHLAGMATAAEISVLAAASLTDAANEVGERYGAETGQSVQFSFAATSVLARQIEAGAPADIFLSANRQWMDRLAEKGLLDADSRRDILGNRLVLIGHEEMAAGWPQDFDLARLPELLPPGARLALADPAHVPAGLYAREALTALDVWAALAPRLALSPDVRAALALVARGEAPLGIVYETDARLVPTVHVLARFPADSHTAITYPFAILKDRHTDEVAAFFDYLTGPEGMAVFESYGFTRN